MYGDGANSKQPSRTPATPGVYGPGDARKIGPNINEAQAGVYGPGGDQVTPGVYGPGAASKSTPRGVYGPGTAPGGPESQSTEPRTSHYAAPESPRSLQAEPGYGQVHLSVMSCG